jgi:hypothetical protein
LLGALALLSGCGGGDDASRPAAAATQQQRAAPPPVPNRRPPTDDEVRRGLRLPDRVPLHARGAAPRAKAAVVRAWLDLLRRGRIRAAAGLFDIPARFQNLSTVAIIATPVQALAITRSLPCGARLLRVGGGTHGFVVYEARLTDRPGGACGSGAGGIVRGAILVRGGRIVEWYRLPDEESPPGRSPQGGDGSGAVV